jgi:hypothetical protein
LPFYRFPAPLTRRQRPPWPAFPTFASARTSPCRPAFPVNKAAFMHRQPRQAVLYRLDLAVRLMTHEILIAATRLQDRARRCTRTSDG